MDIILILVAVLGACCFGGLVGATIASTSDGLPVGRRRAVENALRTERPDDQFVCVSPAWSITVITKAGTTRQIALTERLVDDETPHTLARRAAAHLRDGPGVLVHFVPPESRPRRTAS